MSNEKKPTFYEKLINARKSMKHPERSGRNNFKKYDYATLQDLYDSCLEPLLKNGLMVVHQETWIEGNLCLVTKIIDGEIGEICETMSKLDPTLNIQEYGGVLTYFKKYHLSGLLCLRTDYDDDGESVQQAQKETITEEEAKNLADLLKGRKKLWDILSKKFGINAISEIPKHQYKAISAYINRCLINEDKENTNDNL